LPVERYAPSTVAELVHPRNFVGDDEGSGSREIVQRLAAESRRESRAVRVINVDGPSNREARLEPVLAKRFEKIGGSPTVDFE
jgi:hypothetical protein